MESNEKGVDREGEKINYQTGTIIWGGAGTNAQHAFFNIFTRTKLIPADFIGFKIPYTMRKNTKMLMANFVAQTEALMHGKTRAEAEKELKEKGLSQEQIDA